ncbi:MAG TPA: AAA family ATPase [Bacillota bacterium]
MEEPRVHRGPGSGKSRAASALAQAYRELGILYKGSVLQVAAADLAGGGPEETGKLVSDAFHHASGGILMISDAHDWHRLPDHGDQELRRLYEKLTEYRDEADGDVAVILAGQADPVCRMLRGFPPLAARFSAVIDFPGYTPGQLAAIFTALAGEAGLQLTTAARAKAAAVIVRAEAGRPSGNARLAVALLNQATAAQARRVAAASPRQLTPGMLAPITEADIPGCLRPSPVPGDDDRPGQYL